MPVVAVLVAACGDDSLPDSGGSSSTAPPAAPAVIAHPTDPDVAVVRIESGAGGFTTPEFAFGQIPDMVVGGDGRLVRPGPQIEIYPAPMLPALESAQLSEAEVQALLALADQFGLLAAPPDYEAAAPEVTDVGSTIVTLSVRGETFVHSAYALGFDTETDQPRQRLSDFVTAVREALFPEVTAEVFSPEQYAVGWMEVDLDEYEGSDVEPTVVPWPESFGALAEHCTLIDGIAVTEALASANQLTFFSYVPNDTPAASDATARTVRVLLRPILPGSEGC